jgi:Bacteriophage tail sheath protein
MPEYLAPGVYVEEVPSRRSIEGVSTTVAGFIGPTRYGPIYGDPELLTSYLDFSRIYCGVDQLNIHQDGTIIPQANYMAHAVRAFFDNGGTKLYVTRVYGSADQRDFNSGKASLTISSLPGVTLRARFAGEAGNMQITFAVRTTPNLLVPSASGPQLRGVSENDLVFVKPGTSSLATPGINDALYDVVTVGNALVLQQPQAVHSVAIGSLDPSTMRVHRITLTVLARRAGLFETEETWSDLSPNPNGRNPVTAIFTAQPQSRQLQLTAPFEIETATAGFLGAELVEWLFGSTFVNTTLSRSLATPQELGAGSLPGSLPTQTRPTLAQLQQVYTLQNGSDGNLPSLGDYQGQEAARDPATNVYTPASGLESFADIDEISMIAAPGLTYNYSDAPTAMNPSGRVDAIALALIEHCEIRMKYRVALLDSPNNFIVSEVQQFRGKFDSSYAALYYPWPRIMDPLDPDNRREIVVSPSGFVSGICARSDVAHGVSKAPANEVALGAIDLELLLNKAQQDVLNPIGINCFRFFPDRGFRLWGARTISSDPDWKYLSTRRYFNYVEHSIDKGTQWVVFEKNDEVTWANVTQTVYDFLYNEWRNEALMGTSPAQAFFVRCDRSTMTQNDLDNGRLVCLIGIAVIKPAEFVIFRIGQFTAAAA